jgi:hypothetical protein
MTSAYFRVSDWIRKRTIRSKKSILLCQLKVDSSRISLLHILQSELTLYRVKLYLPSFAIDGDQDDV